MKKRGFTLTELLVTIAVITLLILILLPALAKMRDQRRRTSCANNLRQIGIAMLVYSGDYGDESIPRAGSLNSRWTGRIPNWQGKTRAEAYGLDANAPEISVSATFYLLVKYSTLTPSPIDPAPNPSPRVFVCPADTGTTPFEFHPAKFDAPPDTDLADLWDFGPNPSDHVSYAYHLPYGPYPLRTSNPPGFAVIADRNPWLISPGANPRNFNAFNPNGAREAIKAGNTPVHKEVGQNVLFMDGRTSFEKSSACAHKNDNIYTSHNGPDIKKGTPPTLKSQPADPNDSLLLHDPPLTDQK
jgi:prepilin-type N-terminal cleavage/methylation domain-containing protein